MNEAESAMVITLTCYGALFASDFIPSGQVELATESVVHKSMKTNHAFKLYVIPYFAYYAVICRKLLIQM